MPHVGLNLVFLVPGEIGGMEVYARELIPELVAQRPDLKFTAFINREAAAADGPWGDLIPSVTLPVRSRNRVEWVRGEQQYLPRAAAGQGVDVVHSLATTAPAWGRFRRVTTIHDLIYRLAPEAAPPAQFDDAYAATEWVCAHAGELRIDGSRVAVAGVRPNVYRSVPTDDRDVKTALNFALADQKKKNRSDSAIRLSNVLSAEHQESKGDNYRLCLSLDRRGRPDTARTVVHRNQKQQWSVALWAWGAC